MDRLLTSSVLIGDTHSGNRKIPALRLGKGFSTCETLAAMGIVAIVAGLAIPAYQDAIEKRKITNGAEQIVAFVSTLQTESIKRNRPVTVSYSSQEDGSWCVGAVMGRTACDCTETESTEAAFCGIDSTAWILRDSDVQVENLISSVSGDGSYAFDPVRGMFIDPADMLVLGLNSGDGQYQMNLSVINSGRVSLCLPSMSDNIPGFTACEQDL